MFWTSKDSIDDNSLIIRAADIEQPAAGRPLKRRHRFHWRSRLTCVQPTSLMASFRKPRCYQKAHLGLVSRVYVYKWHTAPAKYRAAPWQVVALKISIPRYSDSFTISYIVSERGNFVRKILWVSIAFSLISIGIVLPSKSLAFDMDCKLILCLPAGFPSGCSDAYSTFIRRITAVPPKPPIGFCAMGSVRDIEMHDSHPDRLDVMSDVIDQAGMERTLRSVKVEYYRSQGTCCRGRECDDEYPCTFTYLINGDGSGFRHRNINGHHTGSKVFYTDLDGKACVAGNSRSWVPPRTQCRTWGRDDDSYCWTVRPGFWQRNATCQLGE